jgi:site-specific DNA-cytosine methylase
MMNDNEESGNEESPQLTETSSEEGALGDEGELNDPKRAKVEIPFYSNCFADYCKTLEPGKNAFVDKIREYENCAQSDTSFEGDERRMRSSKPKILTPSRQSSRKNRMSDQSLNASNDEPDCDDQERFWIDFEDRILEQDSVDFEGTTYNKNKCYIVHDDQLDTTIYGIKHFLRDSNTALCVEIIDFKKTVLETVQDTSDIEYLGLDCIDEYIQRAGSEKEIRLSDMEEEVEEIKKLPDLMYVERQKGTSALLFGFVDTSNAPSRNGLRSSSSRGIDLFAGAGLASRGFEASCCNIVASVEKNEDAVKSYSRIHNATEFEVSSDGWESILKRNGRVAFHGTVEAFLEKYMNTSELRKVLGFIDIVVLCPPCQGFSKQNIFKEGNVKENNQESLRILTVAEAIRPKVLAFENVLGLWEKDHIAEYFQEIVYGLVNIGYNVQVGKLCASDFGDPQLRPRLILIASLSEIGLPVFPKPTHGRPFRGDDVAGGLLPFVTVRDALKPEEDKHPENDEDNPVNDDGKARNPNQPSGTVLASKSAAHYSKNRFYSLTENAILMGQGADFVAKLEGDKKSKQRQIGNGVPMELVTAIGRAVHNILKWNWEGIDDVHSEPVGNEMVIKLENGSGIKLENGSGMKLESGSGMTLENGSDTKLDNVSDTKLENVSDVKLESESVIDSLMKEV